MICTTCGSEVASGARYCRRCGHPLSVSGPRSVLEAETRTLGMADPHLTGNLAANPTGAAYLAPEQMQAGHPQIAISNVPPKHTKRNILIAAVVVILLLIPLLAGLGVFMLKNQVRTVARRVAPTLPQPPAIPPHPPDVAIPPEAGAADSPLMYPGAEVLLKTSHGNGGSVAQLRTHDSFDKVFEWYNANLKPTKVFNTPPHNAVLKTDKALAIITSSGDETQILLKQGVNDDEPY